jgi:hypothetical protein
MPRATTSNWPEWLVDGETWLAEGEMPARRLNFRPGSGMAAAEMPQIWRRGEAAAAKSHAENYCPGT